MARLIDADALKEFIGKIRAEFNFFTDEERPHYEIHSKALEALNLYLEDAPTIEIVRCKECIHYVKEDGMCDETYSVAYPDEFCSHGERRE